MAPGVELGPYTLAAELGRGGMGVVYEALDPRLKRTVAIKLLPPDLITHDTAKQRFLQEAQAASALDHPNICTIHDVGETDDGQPDRSHLAAEALLGWTCGLAGQREEAHAILKELRRTRYVSPTFAAMICRARRAG